MDQALPPAGSDQGPAQEPPAGAAAIAYREPGALARLLERLRPAVGAVLARHRIPPAEAEDLLQDTCLILLVKAEQVHSPEAWFLSVLRRRCAAYYRRRRLEVAALPFAATASGERPPQVDCDYRHDLATALRSLRPCWRQVVIDSCVLGLTDDTVAQRTGYAPASVRKTRSRALKAMARSLAASHP
jgi:RNA polymerase sigma factor (sigma-70 family)